MSDLIERLEREARLNPTSGAQRMCAEAVAALRAKDERYSEMVRLAAEETSQRLTERKGRLDAESRIRELEDALKVVRHYSGDIRARIDALLGDESRLRGRSE